MAQFTIRIADGLNERIADAAGEDKRSKNSEIEWLLEAGLSVRRTARRHARWPEEVPAEELGEYLSTFDLPPLKDRAVPLTQDEQDQGR